MAKAIMIQGTMSNAGKSLVCAGLCRVFRQDGYRVAPFKSQNMALNSFITDEGLEMGRAQAVQAEAAGIEPSARMNPVLLKPVSDMGSQVIVNGEVVGNMRAGEYFKYRLSLVPKIMEAYESLCRENDIVVIEGAGSPAEINLKRDDIVNMGMAKRAKAPVLLVGDIDRGGVFAQLYGTIALLDEAERAFVKALIVNKFRGDAELLRPGLAMLEEITKRPVAGVLPMLPVDIDDEDSLSSRLERRRRDAVLDIAVIRFPHISNFTDFAALEATPGVGVRYVREAFDLGEPDLVILPGVKNTIGDLLWMRGSGVEAAIKALAARGKAIFGICGGYQMLGRAVRDAVGAEGGGAVAGMDLLPVETEFANEKRRTRVRASALAIEGILAPISRAAIEGYEIHMGRTALDEGAKPLLRLEGGELDGCQAGNVYGCYLHGFFDTAACRDGLLAALCAEKGISIAEKAFDFKQYREKQFDALADGVRRNLDMKLIYEILEKGV